VLGYLAALFTGWGSRRARWTTALLLVLVAVCGSLYTITPFSGDNGSHGWRLTDWVGQTWRYALPKFLVATVLASLGWRALRIPRGVLVALAVFAAAWAAALYAAPSRDSLVVAVVSGVVLAALFSPLGRAGLDRLRSIVGAGSAPDPAKTNGVAGAKGVAGGAEPQRISRPRLSAMQLRFAVVVLVLFALVADASWLENLREQRERGRLELYDLPYLYAVDAANDAPVGFAMTQLRYPFYGRDLRQPVMDVSCRGCARSAWLRTILESGMSVLALGPAPVQRSFAPPEADLRPWVEAEGAPFQALERVGSGAGEGIVLYEVIR
jgi:hypothetical protein